MPYIEMTIDSIRHAMHKDQWLILLKEKAGNRCLPVYVDKVWADLIAEALRDAACKAILDAGIEGWIKQIRDSGGKVGLVIDTADNVFKARFVGRGDEVECGVGKGLAMAVRGRIQITVGEGALVVTQL